MILFPMIISQHMQILFTSTIVANLLNLTNLFPITSQHLQILTPSTTLANLLNLITCLLYISCQHMQVLTTPTTLPEPGNPIPHNRQLALQIMTVPTTLASFMNLVPIIKYILVVLKFPEIGLLVCS